MRIFKLIFLTLLLSQTAYAKKFEVKCYSGSHLVYNNVVDDVSQLDGLLVLIKGKKVTFTNSTCLIEYLLPEHKTKKKK